MGKRTLVLGTYDTARDGLWTLSALTLSDPEYQSKFTEVPGRDGPLDQSTVLTDGVPRYGSRTLTATLESSEGTREEREARISQMINTLDGLRMNIVHPDHPQHYLIGRVRVQYSYNDMVHGAVTVTASCDPWLYAAIERMYTVAASETVQLLGLDNDGRRIVYPEVTVTGTGASVLLAYSDTSVALTAGTYKLTGLTLNPGVTPVYYCGVGTVQITYREAVLR